jgi:hypothetical protein
MSHRTNITLSVKASDADTAVRAVNAIMGKKKDDGSYSNVVNKRPEPVSGGQFIVHLLPISDAKFKEHSMLLTEGKSISLNGGKIKFFLHRKEDTEFTQDKKSEFTVDQPTQRNGGAEQVTHAPPSKKEHDPNPWIVFTTIPKSMTKKTLFTIMNHNICPNVATGCILKDKGKFQTALVFLNKKKAQSNRDMHSFMERILSSFEEDGFIKIDYKYPDGTDGFLKFMMGKNGDSPSFTSNDLSLSDTESITSNVVENVLKDE